MKRRNFVKKISIGTTMLPILLSNYKTENKVPDHFGRVINNVPVGISIIAPSTMERNKSFNIGIRVLCKPYYTKWVPDWQRTSATVNGPFNKSPRGIHYMDNVLPSWNGSINISGSKGFEGMSDYSFSEGQGPYKNDKRPIRILEGFNFKESGVKYIEVYDPITGIRAKSNPILVSDSKQEYNLYWGDLHCHSIFGDGVRSPEELHAFARHETFLDVFSLTEHTEAITDEQWNYFSKVANNSNEPGKFVTLLGGEWTSKNFGHRNFIYPGDSGPIIRSSDPNQNKLENLFGLVGKHNGLVIASHPSSPDYSIDFNHYYHDPEVERLVEVYSIGGSYEAMSNDSSAVKVGTTVVGGLNKGCKLGLIAVGDTHDGRPGDAFHELQDEPESYKTLKKPGITGIWAKELTRESIFDALWNRRVFGTTNHRTILDFSINNFPMGSTIPFSKKLFIKIKVASNINIKRIDLWQDGDIVEIFQTNELAVDWELNLKLKPLSESWLYVRVTLDQNQSAWSSPIWIST